MSTTLEIPRTLRHDVIAHLAHQLWEEQGRPAGRDLEFWLAAEARLRARERIAPVKPQEGDVQGGGPLSSPPAANSPARLPQATAKGRAKHTATMRRR